MQMTTLCYIEKDDKYLMLHRIKKKNDINEGKWIGVGGHAEGSESPEECLKREVQEETGLKLLSYKLSCRPFRHSSYNHTLNVITFVSNQCEPEMMCLFTADKFEGQITSCDEGDLMWVPKKDVLQLPTWEGDAVFLKLLLDNEEKFFTLKLIWKNHKFLFKICNVKLKNLYSIGF